MIELLCTLAGIIAGVAVVASLMSQAGERQHFQAENEDEHSDKILGIADQLQVISHRVAADVSAHSEKVVHFSDRLNDSTEESDRPTHILSTINDIVSANREMQEQLADAQERIARQSRMIEQASKQARTDVLTGLANRRALDEYLSNCLSSQNENEVAGLLLMDIDHFKSFNDSFGHTTGDAVLASFARSISNCCGDQCYAARFGGEEFAVVLQARDAQDLARQAATVRFYVSEQVINYEDLQLKITASGGLARMVADEPISAIYERADEGLYQSKKAGRNRGFWLSDIGWQPFPTIAAEPQLLSELNDAAPESTSTTVADAGPTGKQRAVSEVSTATPSRAVAPAITAPVPASADDAAHPATIAEGNVAANPKPSVAPAAAAPASTAPHERAEILDLQSFLGRLDGFMQQLRNAELPATGVMLQALGLSQAENGQAASSWEHAVSLVQRNLRGIDVVCLYQPYTLCIFMPGCSLDAAIDRGSKLQANLRTAQEQWPGEVCPQRFAIALAGVGDTEDSARFLNRLEGALEEGVDASVNELVVHTGEACHFQQV